MYASCTSTMYGTTQQVQDWQTITRKKQEKTFQTKTCSALR